MPEDLQGDILRAYHTVTVCYGNKGARRQNVTQPASRVLTIKVKDLVMENDGLKSSFKQTQLKRPHKQAEASAQVIVLVPSGVIVLSNYCRGFFQNTCG